MIFLKAYLTKKRKLVDAALHGFLEKEKTKPGVIHKAMRYSVFAGGKRLRPVLCLAGAEVCGGNSARVMPTACALELIHTYSLIHDDLPAMDDDDFRRGRPTSHKVFGEGMAVLAGDALLTFGFELIAGNARIKGVSSESVVRVLEVVAKGIGTLGMVGGQVADMEASGKKHSARELGFIHEHKTGSLITASLVSGAMLVGAAPSQVKALENYGENIGLAFQIVDDVLDIVGDKKLLGKRGSDQDNNKLTFPAVYGLELSKKKAQAAVAKAKKALGVFGERAKVLSALADYMVERQN